MELDKTAIVIAQRSAIELIDLSLVVIRRYWSSILTLSVLGALPFALFPLTQFDVLVMGSQDYATTEGYHARYLYVMAGIVFAQSPLAMCGVTYFLGQAVFIEEPSFAQVRKAIVGRWFALLWIVGILRLALVSIVAAAYYNSYPFFEAQMDIVVFGLCFIVAIYLTRGFRPFAAEILLLERCPLRVKKDKKPTELSYGQRSSWLHSGVSGDVFGTHFGMTFVGIAFVSTLCFGFMFVIGTLVGIWRWGFWMDQIVYPLVLWTLSAWGTVIRFLMYMNSRIRLEGWEVELRLKAEAQRIQEAMQP